MSSPPGHLGPYALLSRGDWLSSIDIREICGLLNPADAIYKLRKKGHIIFTETRVCHDDQGRMHNCAHYRLFGARSRKTK